MAGKQNGPIPTVLTLLAELPKISPGSKVRFLGCVTSYSQGTAILTLEHNHPPGNSVKVSVDVKLVVNSLKSHETQIGEWLNVMGYIERTLMKSTLKCDEGEIKVQALVVWSSGPFNLEGYEKSLDRRVAEAETVIGP